jgi:hypothetical protein
MRIDKSLKRPHVFQRILNGQPSFVSQDEIETPNYTFLIFYPRVIYENVDIVFIEIYCIQNAFVNYENDERLLNHRLISLVNECT